MKISQPAPDPLGIPLTTTVVSGEKADDPLYVPEIKKVQASLQTRGLLHVGDCKMSALGIRAYVANSGDHYLSPLSAVQMPKEKLQALLEPVFEQKQPLLPVYRPIETDSDKEELIAEGFVHGHAQHCEHEGQRIEWQENLLVVHSFKQARAQQNSLDKNLKACQKELQALNRRGRGRKNRNEEETREAVAAILQRHQAEGLLTI